MKHPWSEFLRSPADAPAADAADAIDAIDAINATGDATGEATQQGSLYDGAGPEAPDGGAPGAQVPETGRQAAEKPDAGKPGWPDDWRAQMANGDARAARLLERYTSPDAIGKALMAAQLRIRSGEVKLRPGPEATDEQRAQWRLEHGIPETPGGYDVPILLDGRYDELDDFGKASIDAFRGTFHELDMPPEHASRIMTVANEVAMKQMERQAEADAARQEETEDALRADWGADYRKNITLNARFMQDRLGDGWLSFVTARTPEGMRLADDPKFNRFINQMARAEGGTVLEAGEAVAGLNVQARIDEIRKIMSTDYPKYKRDGLDAEYARLLQGQRQEPR